MPRVASGLVIEAAWATAHLVMYPLGLLSTPTRTPNGRLHQKLSGLTPEQGGLVHHDVGAAETPILLVHGIIDNERIHVIGHSMGGLIARYYVQRLAGDRHVHTLVTLGTPHHGTQLAWAAPLLPLVRQLTPNSSVIHELAEPAPGCRTRFIVFYSDIDHLIVPSSNARLDHSDLNVRNVAVRGVGHLSMANNGHIAFTIAEALRQLDYAPGHSTR